MKKIVYNKLVRDKIPEIIEDSGINCKARELKMADYKKELVKKLVEEAEEVSFKYKSKKAVEEELADVYEVIIGL